MSNMREFCVRLNSFWERGILTNSPTLKELYSDYSRLCHRINKRLEKCEALILQNREGASLVEALRYPSLFDITPQLSTSRLLDFLDLCAQYAFPEPPVVHLSVFKEIEKLHGQENMLPQLLSEWRRYSRDPASETKCIILREIETLDPENAEWSTLLRQTEEGCMPQLVGEAQQAIMESDYERLDELRDFFLSPAWKNIIPEMVQEKISRTLENISETHLSQIALELKESMEIAYNHNDLGSFLLAWEHWSLLCEENQYVPRAAEEQRIEMIHTHFMVFLNKAKHENEQAEMIRQMNLLATSSTPVDFSRIDGLYQRFHSSGGELPQDLLNFYEKQKHISARIRKSAARKRFWRVAFITCALLFLTLTGSAATWLAYQVKWHEQELSKIIAKDDFDQACLLVNTLEQKKIPLMMFNRNLREMVETIQGQIKGEKVFWQKSEEIERRIQSLDLNESDLELLKKEITDIVPLARGKKAKEKSASLEKRTYTLKTELHDRHLKAIRKMIASLMGHWRNYEKELQHGDFKKAEEIFNGIKPSIKTLDDKLNSLAPEDRKKVISNEEEESLPDPLFWVFLRHKYLYDAIKSSISQNDFQKAETLIGYYLEDEKIPTFTQKLNNVNHPQDASSKELTRQLEQQRNAFEVSSALKNVEKDLLMAEKHIADEKYTLAENLIADCKERLKEMSTKSNESQENTLYQLTRRADYLLEVMMQRKAVHSLYAILRKHILDEDNETLEVKEMLKLVEKECLLPNLPVAYVKKMEELIRQLKYFERIQDPAWPVAQSYLNSTYNRFFLDMNRDIQCKKEMARLMSACQMEVNQYIEKNTMRPKYCFAFKDGNGRYHSWYFERRELKFIDNAIGSIAFRIRDENVIIADNGKVYISEAKAKSRISQRMECNNVTFIFPTTPTKKAIIEAVAPYQIMLKRIKEIMPQNQGTIFNGTLYDVLASLAREPQDCIKQRLEIYLRLLNPFLNAGKLENENSDYPIFRDKNTSVAFGEIERLHENIRVLLMDVRNRWKKSAPQHVDDVFRSRLDSIDFSPVQKLCSIVELESQFRKKLLKRSFALIGFAMRTQEGKMEIFASKKAFPRKEVWGFSPNGKTLLVGNVRDGNLLLDESQISGITLLFMPDDEVDTAEEAKGFVDSLHDLGVTACEFPLFFPDNIK